MDKKSKILFITMIILIVISVSATFYKTVVLQDFKVMGVWIEFPTEETSYTMFFYDNEEYELELNTTDREEILTAISDEVGVIKTNLDPAFVSLFMTAYISSEFENINDSE